jgi:hypothetical protein
MFNLKNDLEKTIIIIYLQTGYPDPVIGLGRMADWSSLRKLKPQDYNIYNSFWGKIFIILVPLSLLFME